MDDDDSFHCIEPESKKCIWIIETVSKDASIIGQIKHSQLGVYIGGNLDVSLI